MLANQLFEFPVWLLVGHQSDQAHRMCREHLQAFLLPIELMESIGNVRLASAALTRRITIGLVPKFASGASLGRGARFDRTGVEWMRCDKT